MEFVELSKECCLLEGKLSTILDFGESIKLYALVNNKPYECDIIGRRIPTVTFEEEMVNHTVFKVAIPLHSSCDTQVYFFCSTSLSKIEMKNVRFGPFFPISSQYSTSYFASGNWMMESLKGGIHLMPCKSGLKRRREYAFLREIWTKREFGSRNAVLARCIVHILRPFKCKPFWLISDRTGKAGDNGEAFFRYICQEHPEIDVRFAIAQDSDDYDKLRKVGRVVNFNSRWYKICVLLSDYIVSSAGEVHVYNPFNGYSNPYKDMLATNKFVFLQHGTIIHDLSNWLGRWNKNLTGFVTSAIPENRSILEGNYEYTDKQVWLTGLPRFDRLYNAEEKLITIMPTWRKYLLENWNAHTDMWQLRHGAENSVYVQFYNNLLNHPRLLSAAEKNGYKIQFLPHISMQAHLKIYQKNSQVKFIGRESSYRDIYAKSKLVVTDYSSAVSDFAYMRKPVLYAQFDRDEFYSGGQMYTEGYFDYEKDGFGEVEYDLESTVDRIIEYMENGCQLKDKYRRRIDDFFAYGDKNNSQRVYEKIMELDANR